ncbi:CLUMA_CG010824, isoform A [Clunio marinus]|uniref:CLUMA_CG010824, isoform A n=1 Tax=Clunio marinus TaxID=568069 RepID=A0A1J1IB48_9DIPT|nr:CLUMA_CG010824, isoform A [Clunio marinus]
MQQKYHFVGSDHSCVSPRKGEELSVEKKSSGVKSNQSQGHVLSRSSRRKINIFESPMTSDCKNHKANCNVHISNKVDFYKDFMRSLSMEKKTNLIEKKTVIKRGFKENCNK